MATRSSRAPTARAISGARWTCTPGTSSLGALGFGGAVEKKFDLAVGRDQRDAVAFEDAEIGAVAQVVALPGVAVEHDVVDAGLAHGGHEALAPFLRKHDVRSFKAVVAPHRLGRDIAGA